VGQTCLPLKTDTVIGRIAVAHQRKLGTLPIFL
jgi:hypothetical protein